jgi:hypothetical protein
VAPGGRRYYGELKGPTALCLLGMERSTVSTAKKKKKNNLSDGSALISLLVPRSRKDFNVPPWLLMVLIIVPWDGNTEYAVELG